MSRFREEIIGDARLILGDCREVLPTLPRVDAVVTDPPYGIAITRSNRLSVSRGFGGQTWDDEPADLSWLLPMDVPAIVWGGNYFNLPPTRCPLVWDKDNAGRDFADFEMAWSNLDQVARRFRFRPMNMDGGKEHPTQKPIQVMQWCLSFLPDCRTILDPYMGSGTTGVACARLGHSFVGIEISEQFFDIACRRISEAWKQPRLFEEPRVKPTQEALDFT
jgi:DNA modification methylase